MNDLSAKERDDPARHLPLDADEKFAAFIIYIRALEKAGLSPGYGRISRDEATGIDFSFGLPNFMARNAILTAPETVAEAAEILAQNASGIETEGHDRAAGRGAEHESPTAESGDAQNIAQDIGGPSQ